jgi:hypothetical protein
LDVPSSAVSLPAGFHRKYGLSLVLGATGVWTVWVGAVGTELAADPAAVCVMMDRSGAPGALAYCLMRASHRASLS